jgi:hypothetical protein
VGEFEVAIGVWSVAGFGAWSRATSTTTPYRATLTAWLRSARTFLGRGFTRYDGEGSVDECPGPG